MALLWSESFDGCSTIAQLFGVSGTDDTRLWRVSTTTLQSRSSYLAGGKTGRAYRHSVPGGSGASGEFAGGNAAFAISRLVPASTRLIVGCWYRRSSTANSHADIIGLSTRGIDSNNAGDGIYFRHDNSDIAELWRTVNGTPTLLATPSTGHTFAGNVWYYVELDVVWGGAGSAVTVRVDESTVISGTFDTKGGSANANLTGVGLSFGGATSTIQVDIDDFYVCDGTGSKNNSPLGIVSVVWSPPDGQGFYSDYTNSAAAASSTNYSYVDELSVDDADYIQSSIVGDKDSHTYTDISSPGPIVAGVVHCVRGGNTGDGRSVKSLARENATDALSADLGLTGTLRSLYAVYENDPAAVEWTTTTVNNAEFGVETT